MEASSPEAALYDIVDSSNRRASAASESSCGVKSNGAALPFHPTSGRNDGCKVLGHRKQRDAAGGGQPLVPAAHQRVGSPGAHGDRDGTGHLSDIDDDPGSNASSTRSEGRDIDLGSGRELNRADADDGCSLGDGVDHRLREVRGRNVGNPADAHARTLMGGQPRVGHAREVAGHQDHLTVRAGQQCGKLTEALTRSAHHRDRHQPAHRAARLQPLAASRGSRPRPGPTGGGCHAGRHRSGSGYSPLARLEGSGRGRLGSGTCSGQDRHTPDGRSRDPCQPFDAVPLELLRPLTVEEAPQAVAASHRSSSSRRRSASSRVSARSIPRCSDRLLAFADSEYRQYVGSSSACWSATTCSAGSSEPAREVDLVPKGEVDGVADGVVPPARGTGRIRLAEPRVAPADRVTERLGACRSPDASGPGISETATRSESAGSVSVGLLLDKCRPGMLTCRRGRGVRGGRTPRS